MKELSLEKPHREALQVASQMPIRNKDISLIGLDPTDPLQYLRGRERRHRRTVPDEIKIAAGRLRKKYNVE